MGCCCSLPLGGTRRGNAIRTSKRPVIWKGCDGNVLKVLTVYFYEKNYAVDNDTLLCFSEEVTSEMVIKLVNDHWRSGIEHIEYGDCIPRFEEVKDKREANIRVKFRITGPVRASRSHVGSCANDSNPTMTLDLRNLDDYHIQATILHEFGHALGLAHEHQQPEFWNVMERFLHVPGMLGCSQFESEPEFRAQCLRLREGKGNYDAKSIMHYSTDIEWLKPAFRHLTSEDLVDKEEGLNSEERMYLKHFLNHIQFQTSVPSEGDKEFVAKQYYEESLKVKHHLPNRIAADYDDSANTATDATPLTTKSDNTTTDATPLTARSVLLSGLRMTETLIKPGDDVTFLLEGGKLSMCSYKWDSIAMMLGFDHGHIKAIGRNNPGDVQACMIDAFNIWSTWPNKQYKKKPTLESLCKALHSVTVGFGTTATDLEEIRAKLPSLQVGGACAIDYSDTSSSPATSIACKQPVTQNYDALKKTSPSLTLANSSEVSGYIEDLDVPRLYELGGQLGLKTAKLRKIPSLQLSLKMSELWLQQDYNVSKIGAPSWKRLVTALRSVGANGVADRVEMDKLK